MPKFSIITPVFNRPNEVFELLESLTKQNFKDFEVIIVEDGSSQKCEEVCSQFKDSLNVKYFFKENTGQGFSRNFAFEKAQGDYFIQLDSDVLVPEQYFDEINKSLAQYTWDAFGGPDAAHSSFSPIQKAINYAMTSVFTTGGIRGKKTNMGGQFTPRSFNFGLSRKVWEKVGGYKITRMGEDIEFSKRIIEAGFKVGLIPEAFIFHKRRTSLRQFFNQLHFFGRARINIARFYPEQLKLVHFFPAAFTLFLLACVLSFFIYPPIAFVGLTFFAIYCSLLFFDALRVYDFNIKIATLSLLACLVQLVGYGIGFLSELPKGLEHKKTRTI
ncbi:Glycosyltransferase, catalytic subunit of cellulose synthase and poly-beta-1,6-N-acetylglucosamine synthase [Spirosomataceae bacterium TFI 002]|nr:Glycosyltransferase, catalytic subunit of cellulose synthase and poly-beta-1,6-N-acetylglucosamine synthase [Spirosomataceae bacterium TFI 002]